MKNLANLNSSYVVFMQHVHESKIFTEDNLVAIRNKVSFRVITDSLWFSGFGLNWDLKTLRLTCSFCRFSNVAQKHSPVPSSYSQVISITVKFSSYLNSQNTLSASIPLPLAIGSNLNSPGASWQELGTEFKVKDTMNQSHSNVTANTEFSQEHRNHMTYFHWKNIIWEMLLQRL